MATSLRDSALLNASSSLCSLTSLDNSMVGSRDSSRCCNDRTYTSSHNLINKSHIYRPQLKNFHFSDTDSLFRSTKLSQALSSKFIAQTKLHRHHKPSSFRSSAYRKRESTEIRKTGKAGPNLIRKASVALLDSSQRRACSIGTSILCESNQLPLPFRQLALQGGGHSRGRKHRFLQRNQFARVRITSPR